VLFAPCLKLWRWPIFRGRSSRAKGDRDGDRDGMTHSFPIGTVCVCVCVCACVFSSTIQRFVTCIGLLLIMVYCFLSARYIGHGGEKPLSQPPRHNRRRRCFSQPARRLRTCLSTLSNRLVGFGICLLSTTVRHSLSRKLPLSVNKDRLCHQITSPLACQCTSPSLRQTGEKN